MQDTFLMWATLAYIQSGSNMLQTVPVKKYFYYYFTFIRKKNTFSKCDLTDGVVWLI